MTLLLVLSTKGSVVATRIVSCVGSEDRRVGLLKRESLGVQEGILMELPKYRRKLSGFFNSIHMLFMKFPIAVVWMDDEGVVVSSQLAEPWRYYSSPRPATYILEVHPSLLPRFSIGTKVSWVENNNPEEALQ